MAERPQTRHASADRAATGHHDVEAGLRRLHHHRRQEPVPRRELPVQLCRRVARDAVPREQLSHGSLTAFGAEQRHHFARLAGLEIHRALQCRAGIGRCTRRLIQDLAGLTQPGRVTRVAVAPEEFAAIRGPRVDGLTQCGKRHHVRERRIRPVAGEDGAQLPLVVGHHLMLCVLALHPKGPLGEVVTVSAGACGRRS